MSKNGNPKIVLRKNIRFLTFLENALVYQNNNVIIVIDKNIFIF